MAARSVLKAAVVAVLVAALVTRLAQPADFPVHHPASSAIVITGASTGIGRHAAVSLARMGFTVFASVRKETDAASLRAENIATLHPLTLEVTSAESQAAALKTVTEHLAAHNLTLAAMVSNAGISFSGPIEAFPIEQYLRLHDVNFVGALRTIQTYLPLIRASRGRIVNVGSVVGISAVPVHGLYAATKFALRGLTDSLRREMMLHGVSVSYVAPGAVATAIEDKANDANTAMLNAMAPADKAAYDPLMKAYIAARDHSFTLASPPSVTTDAIVDAITNPLPQTTYVVATTAGWPAWMLASASYWLPDRLMDTILFKAMKL